MKEVYIATPEAFCAVQNVNVVKQISAPNQDIFRAFIDPNVGPILRNVLKPRSELLVVINGTKYVRIYQ
jgi:hypothetical protein